MSPPIEFQSGSDPSLRQANLRTPNPRTVETPQPRTRNLGTSCAPPTAKRVLADAAQYLRGTNHTITASSFLSDPARPTDDK